ncbi:MAG: hypothetical protein IPN25_04735 [Sphingobacteriales bacterium]|nr:hypothetical protein [Sphingobacteriales bacterium]
MNCYFLLTRAFFGLLLLFIITNILYAQEPYLEPGSPVPPEEKNTSKNPENISIAQEQAQFYSQFAAETENEADYDHVQFDVLGNVRCWFSAAHVALAQLPPQ